MIVMGLLYDCWHALFQKSQQIREEQNLKKKQKFPSKEVLELLSWSIFLTSIHEDKADYKSIFELYKLRWRIETIFKTMKSHLKVDKAHNVSSNQLSFIIVAKMILFLLIFQFIFSWFAQKIEKHFGRELSLFKLCRYLVDNFTMVVELINIAMRVRFQKNNKQSMMLVKYCTYNKRKWQNYNRQLKDTA